MSPVSEARKRANEKYTKANYDEIKVRVPKGKKKIIQQCAMNVGESTTSFINHAIDERIEREGALPAAGQKQPTQATPPEAAVPEANKEKPHKPFTEEDVRKVDLQELLSNIQYQLNISDTFGIDVLTTLLERARQQAAVE